MKNMGQDTILLTQIDSHLSQYASALSVASMRFRFWHVESLLNKSADLLDRCLTEQDKYDSLRAQYAALSLSMAAEANSIAIEAERDNAGEYKFPALDAENRFNAASAIQSSQKSALEEAHHKFANTTDNNNNVIYWDHDASAKRSEHEMELCEVEKRRLNDDKLGFEALSKRRLAESQKIKDARLAYCNPGGAMDYAGRAQRSQELIDRDYFDAVDRLRVAAFGLAKLYGYDGYLDDTGNAVGFDSILNSIRDGKEPPLGATAFWVREAIRWMAAFAQRDQTFSITVSVRKALGTDWVARLRTGKPIPFPLDEALFVQHRFVRLRGISATFSAKPGSSISPIRCIVRMPRKAKVLMQGEDGKKQCEVAIDQEVMPPCVLGNVMDMRMPYEAEVCGAVSLMNCSPFGVQGEEGNLSISMEEISDTQVDLDDIFLTLKVSAQPALSQ